VNRVIEGVSRVPGKVDRAASPRRIVAVRRRTDQAERTEEADLPRVGRPRLVLPAPAALEEARFARDEPITARGEARPVRTRIRSGVFRLRPRAFPALSSSP